jgi:hypothetical protein
MSRANCSPSSKTTFMWVGNIVGLGLILIVMFHLSVGRTIACEVLDHDGRVKMSGLAGTALSGKMPR